MISGLREQRKSRRIRSEFERFIRERAIQGASAPQIRQELIERFPEGKDRKIPDPRVVRDIVREHRTEDLSGPWQLGDSDSDADAAAVLAAMTAVHKYRRGAVITRAEAEWIARIAPHVDYGWEEDGRSLLQPDSLWILARQYLASRAHQRSTLPIDLLLAFKPWREDQRWRSTAYQEALDRLGLQQPTYLWLLPEDSDE